MIPGHNLKCQTPADVYLLLKSSDFITHDLDHAFETCIDVNSVDTTGHVPPEADLVALTERIGFGDNPDENAKEDEAQNGQNELELVLKKWYDIPKSQEWRCFVRERQLLGEFGRAVEAGV